MKAHVAIGIILLLTGIVAVPFMGAVYLSDPPQETQTAEDDISDEMWEVLYHASFNCRYYCKQLDRCSSEDKEAYFKPMLERWDKLHKRLLNGDLTEVEAWMQIDKIQALEREPDHALLLEAQHDENEAHWGKGIRTYEQCLTEATRRKRAKENAQ